MIITSSLLEIREKSTNFNASASKTKGLSNFIDKTLNSLAVSSFWAAPGPNSTASTLEAKSNILSKSSRDK